jgi:alpha-glucosidase
VSRDGCRVPLPWNGDVPPYGFGPAGCDLSWLPSPPAWAALSVTAQTGDPTSTLELYRAALRLRREHPALADEGKTITWLETEPGLLAFTRDTASGTGAAGGVVADRGAAGSGGDGRSAGGVVCAVNLSGAPMRIDGYGRPLLASEPLPDTADGVPVLPVDTAAWFEAPQGG